MSYTHSLTGEAELTKAQWELVSGLSLGGRDDNGVFLDVLLGKGGRNMFFLTQQLAEQALLQYLGAMKTLMAQEQRDGFAVVIADPDGRILLVHVEDNPSKWKYPYLAIALAKCRMALENKQNTRLRPAVLIREGDTLYVGGVWLGLSLAVSGFTEAVDEDFGRKTAEAMIVLAEADRRLWEKQHPNSHFYE